MRPFRLFVDQEAIELLQGLKKRVRDELQRHLKKIRDNPRQYSDYQETDEQGRLTDISVCKNHAIQYWIDHADRHIKVLEISSADHQRRHK